MKVIRFNTPTGVYCIPLQKVAEHRADYYACEVDGHEKHSSEWNSEVEYVMSDSFEGIDWILNNTDFEDWEHCAKKINGHINVTEDDFWTSSEDFEIVSMFI